MAKHSKVNPAETKADVLDKIFKDVDAEIVLAGMLGATAAAGGLTPPLTRLLQTFNEALTGEGNDYLKVLGLVSPAAAYAYLGTSLADLIMGVAKDSAIPEQDRIKVYGLMASGALEAMIMMNLVKNKELMNQVLGIGKDLGAAAITAAGQAVPF